MSGHVFCWTEAPGAEAVPRIPERAGHLADEVHQITVTAEPTGWSSEARRPVTRFGNGCQSFGGLLSDLAGRHPALPVG